MYMLLKDAYWLLSFLFFIFGSTVLYCHLSLNNIVIVFVIVLYWLNVVNQFFFIIRVLIKLIFKVRLVSEVLTNPW